ncbi:MAG: CPBP family intramembrane metalloprotease [Defluviitaleaceae bacterium]|nr:CPBP family intramembrane metalloprotease [Defluviitaleaceae bacterium]
MNPRKANIFMLVLVLFQVIVMVILNFTDFPLAGNLVLSQAVVFLVPSAIFLIFFRGGEKVNSILKFKKMSGKNVALIIIMGFLVQPATMAIGAITSLFSENILAEVMLELTSLPFLGLLFVVAVVPSICEEIAFRGVVFKGYEKASMKKLIIVNGLFFGFMHGNFQQFFYTFLLGILIALLVYYTGSMFSAMLFHFILNGSQVVLLSLVSFLEEFLESQGYALAEADTSSSPIVSWVIIGFIVLVATFGFIKVLKIFIKANPLPEKTLDAKEKHSIATPSFVTVCVIYTLLMVFALVAPYLQ